MTPTSSRATPKSGFDHERLKVYQDSVRFVAWAETALENITKPSPAVQQLERATVSIPLNIAEGTGKWTAADKCRYYDIARGSAVECAACLDVLMAQRRIAEAVVTAGKELLVPIVAMLMGLIRATAPSRLGEEAGEYVINTFREDGQECSSASSGASASGSVNSTPPAERPCGGLGN